MYLSPTNCFGTGRRVWQHPLRTDRPAAHLFHTGLPATCQRPGTRPPFRPWHHLHRLGLPGTAATGRHHLLQGEAGHLSGQRRRGDLLRNPEGRAHPPEPLAHACRRGPSHLRLCRNVVQPAPSARKPWHPQPRRLRSLPTVCPVRSQTHDCPINGCKSTRNKRSAFCHAAATLEAGMSLFSPNLRHRGTQ